MANFFLVFEQNAAIRNTPKNQRNLFLITSVHGLCAAYPPKM